MVGEPEVQFSPSLTPPLLFYFIFAGSSLPWSGLPGSPRTVPTISTCLPPLLKDLWFGKGKGASGKALWELT